MKKAGVNSAFVRDNRGGIAFEFALILPVMLSVILGLVEISRLLNAKKKVELIAHAMADLVAQKTDGGDYPGQAGLNDDDVLQIYAAAKTLLAPLPPDKLRIGVSEVRIRRQSSTPSGITNWVMRLNNPAADQTKYCAVVGGGGVKWLSPSEASPSMNIPDIKGASDSNLDIWILIADVSYSYSPGFSFAAFSWKNAPSWTWRVSSYAPVRNTYSDPDIQYKVTNAASGEKCSDPGT
jgi:hypothetical protein